MNDAIETRRPSEEREAPAETARGARLYRPVADIVETEAGVTLAIDMPGVAPEDVEIDLEKHVLTIRGRSKQTQAGDFQLVYAEYGEGDYERAFTLSEDLDEKKIKARMRDGVLTLTLPRAAAAKPRRIAVSAG